MKKLALAVLASLVLISPAVANPEDVLSARVLKITHGIITTTVLLELENKGTRRFSNTKWSCVYLINDKPVGGSDEYFESVLPNKKEVRNFISTTNDLESVNCHAVGVIE
jgi:hypothetical protein